MAEEQAKRDSNSIPTLIGVSNADGVTPIRVWIDAATHAMLVSASINVTGGAVSQNDNSAFTAGTTPANPMAGFYHSTIDTVTDGRAAALAIDSKRNLFVVLRDAAGNARGVNVDANNNLGIVLAAETTKVIGTVNIAAAQSIAATQSGTWTVRTAGASGGTLDAVVTAATSPANGVMGLGIYNSTEPSPSTGQSVGIQLDSKGRQRQVIMDAAGNTRGANVNASNELLVALSSVPSHAVTNAGTFAVQAAGDVAHDSADSGNPVKVGAKAVSAEPTPVTANDRANLIADLVGKLIVLPYANPENFVSGAITSAMTGTTSTSLIAAPAAGLRNYLTTIICSNAHATVGTDIVIQDGNGGTTLLTIPAAAVYGGAVVALPTPLRQPTTATAIYCANVTTGASTKVSAVGYKGA